MIIEKDGVFYLSTNNTSYWFRTTKFGHLEHLDAVIPAVVVAVHPWLPARSRVVRRVTVPELFPSERIATQKVLGLALHQLGWHLLQTLPRGNHALIQFNGNAAQRRLFVTQHRSATQVRLDVYAVRRHEIDHMVERTAFATWILHAPNHRQI